MLTFYLHFNRIAMQRGDPNVWSIRTSKGCFHAKNVVIQVPLETVFRENGPNPRAFLKGRGNGYTCEMKFDNKWKKCFLLTAEILE